MNSQTARNVIRNYLNTSEFQDDSIKTALQIAIEDMDALMISDWHEGRDGDDLELKVFLGYSEEEYGKYIMGISKKV